MNLLKNQYRRYRIVLFQMCYGPEIKSIFEVISNRNGCTLSQLQQNFQYDEKGDISSLLDGVLKFLKEIKFITDNQGKYEAITSSWSVIDIFIRLRSIEKNIEEFNLNYVFVTMYEQLFVQKNQMYISDLYQEANSHYKEIPISEEKINAWKRMMEFFGLGYRVYSGFYALPHLQLIKDILHLTGEWEGPLQLLLQNKINPILPCINSGQAYIGLIHSLTYLHEINKIQLQKKQDLPYNQYGPDNSWNWVRIGGGGV